MFSLQFIGLVVVLLIEYGYSQQTVDDLFDNEIRNNLVDDQFVASRFQGIFLLIEAGMETVVNLQC